MVNEFESKISFIQKIENYFKQNKVFLIGIATSFVVIILLISYYNFYQTSKNEKISEKYIEAGLYLASKDKEKSKEIYKEIILSKNKFYSLLSLNNIIDNNLEENSEKVLKLFDVIENMRINNERKNLIKLKKALYLKKIFKNNEANKLITEIIKDNSIWKDISEILK
jgi:hypothetical protein